MIGRVNIALEKVLLIRAGLIERLIYAYMRYLEDYQYNSYELVEFTDGRVFCVYKSNRDLFSVSPPILQEETNEDGKVIFNYRIKVDYIEPLPESYRPVI